MRSNTMETSGSEDISRPSSPANSVISFSTDDVNILLREFGGRLLNSQNEMYVLPVDDREHARLDYQHRALTLTLDSLYAAPDLVRAVMTPSQKRSPAAVDLGAGSGQWVIEFAEEFPHATVVGIDLAPPTNFHKPIPSNCRFEVDDVNYSLSHYAKSFDVCHMRSIECGINDYEDLIYRVAQILRTNGVLLMASGGDQLYGEDRKPLPQEVAEGQPGWCAAQALFSATHSSGLESGNSSDSHYNWARWLSTSPYYTSIGIEDVFIPIGPWMEDLDKRCTYIAQLMQTDVKQIFESFKPPLLSSGYDEELVDRWISLAQKEVTEMRPRLFAKWRYAWAVRNSTQWVEPSFSD